MTIQPIDKAIAAALGVTLGIFLAGWAYLRTVDRNSALLGDVQWMLREDVQR